MTSSSSPAREHPRKAFGWAAQDNSGVLAPFTFSRRNTGDDDVTLKILYCGICHTDLSIVKNEWGNAVYPVVPGHEITGIVSEVGRNVNRFKVGDKVGVGCLVGSCRSCGGCNAHAENFCPKQVFTYNGIDSDGTKTYGGYSNMIVVNEHFVVKFPDNLPMDKGAPLLCAGITVYSPMKKFGLNVPGKHIGVVGLGGVGHVAVKFAKALGVKVTVISSSASKEKEAIEHLGADSFILSSNPEAMQAAMFSLDGIINTVSSAHDLVPLLNLLQPNGQMILVGMPDKPFQLPVFPLSFAARVIAGTYIGGIKDTQEMMDLAGKHNITADIELIPRDYVNKAMERLEKGDVRYRFVIDVANPGAKAKSNL